MIQSSGEERGEESNKLKEKRKKKKDKESNQSIYSENKTFSPSRLIFENTINLHLKPLAQNSNNFLSKGF